MKQAGRGEFTPENPSKYTGEYPVVWRSTWELDFMIMCDRLESIISWASEPVQIPYNDPLTGKQKVYIPDFLVSFISGGTRRTKLLEIKPLHETHAEFARSHKDAAIQARNNAKWGAAMMWCAKRSDVEGNPVEFDVMTEREAYTGHLNRVGRMNPVRTYAQAVQKQQRPKVAKPKGYPTIEAMRKKAARFTARRSGVVGRVRSARAGKVKSR